MTFREMVAVVQLLGVAAVGGWLGWDVLRGGMDGASAGIAIKLLWAVGAMIAFNVLGTVFGAILLSIAQREEVKDEPADERDHAISARSLRNSGIATSIASAVALIPLAMGVDPNLAVYMLFAAPVLGGTVNALSELYYYRTM